MHDTSAAAPVSDGERDSTFWTPLLHRWFIRYNPFYLLSATLVLTGMIAWSHGIAQVGSVDGSLVVAGVAELYAAALIGGAALLMRIGQRRPAVMLALLTALYQGDVTLHTETCAYLSKIGALASYAWFAIFVIKLHALAWAMRVRLSLMSYLTAAFGAAGLLIFPRALPFLGSGMGSALMAFWLYSLCSLHSFQEVTPAAPLDAWGAVVFRRAVRAIWLLWLALGLGHVFFWSTERSLQIAPFLAAAALWAVRKVRRESRVWLLVASVLASAAWIVPDTFFITALIAALALGLRAWPKLGVQGAVNAPSVSPYRATENGSSLRPPLPAPFPFGDAARKRLFVGSLGSLYLAVWTSGWTGGAWPAHILALDMAMSLGMLLLIWRARIRTAVLPPAACLVHGVAIAGMIPVPHSLVAWGSTTVAAGFVVLFGTLGANYWLRNTLVRRT